MHPEMIRLGDQQWGFTRPEEGEDPDIFCDSKIEVRVVAADYQQACIGYHAVHELGVQVLMNEAAMVEVEGVDTVRWKITRSEAENKWKDYLGGYLRMFMRIKPLHSVSFDVSPLALHEGRMPSFITNGVELELELDPDDIPPALVQESLPAPSLELYERLQTAPFQDSFTRLAAEAFQKWEREFTTRKDFIPTCKIVSWKDRLLLEPLNKTRLNAQQRQLNRQTVAHYRDFLGRQYGSGILPAVQARYGVDLDGMFDRGEALCPEHIYRINQGLNNIEIQELEVFFEKLPSLLAELRSRSHSGRNLDDFLCWYDLVVPSAQRFTVREMQGLIRVLGSINGEAVLLSSDLRTWLEDIIEACPQLLVCTLDPMRFDQILRCIWTPSESWDEIFTGRKIEHKAIMGFYTTADKTHFKPWLDQQELLQILPECSDPEDWENFYERMSHIASKKHLVRSHPDDLWRVGALIPAPDAHCGQKRWYIVSSCMDDHQGDFHYTLEPATHSTDIPFIKLYRSTASSKYAMNSWISVEADLSPKSAPGGYNRWAGDHYEFPYIKERTLAVWVGYLLQGLERQARAEAFQHPANDAGFREIFRSWQELAREWRSSLESLQSATVEMCDSHITRLKAIEDPTDLSTQEIKALIEKRAEELKTWKGVRKAYKKDIRTLPAIPDDMTSRNLELLKKQVGDYQTWILPYKNELVRQADVEKELPKYKIGGDLAFVGHSLGGALSQGGMYHFTVELGRIPLPGRRFICYASDAPALNPGESQAFLAFGEKHRDLFHHFDQRWRVIQQMEHGDLIPMGGNRHLGAVNRRETTWRDWLDLKIQIFRPIDQAHSLEIYDPPTHGRRIGQATHVRDYELQSLTPSQLRDLDTAWFLSPAEQEMWGYAPWMSPKIVEGTRRALGYLEQPVQWFNKRVVRRLQPQRGDEVRDENWYFFCALTRDHGIHLV